MVKNLSSNGTQWYNKKRYTHEDIIQALGQLLEIEKWDDTNFITFENYIFSIARTIKSNDTRISYQILWKKYLEKKWRSRTAKNVALVSDEVTKILEVIPEYAWGASHEGIWQYSIGK